MTDFHLTDSVCELINLSLFQIAVANVLGRLLFCIYLCVSITCMLYQESVVFAPKLFYASCACY